MPMAGPQLGKPYNHWNYEGDKWRHSYV